jgi:hypothetical protein
MKKAIFIVFALLLPMLGPVFSQGLGTGDTRTSNNRFKGPIPWANALANGATCNGVADDTTALVDTFNAVGTNGDEFQIDDNCNLMTPPNPFSTPTQWVTMHLRGKLLIGSMLKLAPLVLLDGSFAQKGGNVNFGFLPQAPVAPSFCSTSPVIDLSGGGVARNIYIGQSGAGSVGYGCFTGTGFNETSIADVYLDNVSAQTNATNAQPLLATGSFGLRVYKSQFSPGPLGTKPCITLQDNATNGDFIRYSILNDIFCAHQGIRWGSSGSYSYGGPSDGLSIEHFLFENSTGSNNYAGLNIDTTNNGKQNLYLRDIYIADSSTCTLNTGPNTSGNNRLSTVEIIQPIGGGCIKGSENIVNLWAHTSAHIGIFLPSGAPSWTGAILADGEMIMTEPGLPSGLLCGNCNASLESWVPNDVTTGTVQYRIAKISNSGNAMVIAPSDSNAAAIGICISTCGTFGAARITTVGQADCRFDNGVATPGDYVTISSLNDGGNGGECHDIGSTWPTTGKVIGIVLTGRSGSYAIWLFGPGVPGAAQTSVAQTWTAQQTIAANLGQQFAEGTAPRGAAGHDILYADSISHRLKFINNNGTPTNVAGASDLPLSGTSDSIGGSALLAGHCASSTITIANATTGMTVSVSPKTYPGDGFIPWGYVSAKGIVTVKLCAQASGTPAASTYNVRVIQ